MAASPSPSSDSDSDERVSIGSVLDGRYRIDALIGTGGMGRVYRAEHTGIGRAVAIKVLHSDLNRNKEAAQRFQREAIASGRLDHPNIVGVSDFGVFDDGSCYLVMEVLEGESVGDRIARDKRIPWREALSIIRSVLLGLRHAHERGVVHRDIKPDNIYLAKKDGDTIVKILDFGIAKLRAGTADDPASTRAGLTVGTPAYLSPEQAVGGEITPASDLYSATIVLVEMLAGQTPFVDKDPLAMLGAHVSRQPPRVADLAPDVELPLGLEEIIQEGLVKTSKDRIGSANEYIAKLDAIVAMRTSSSMLLPPMTAPEPAPAAPLASPPPGAIRSPAPDSIPPSPMVTPLSNRAATPIPTATALPPSTRPVSLHDIQEPVPRRWVWIGGLVLLVLTLAAIIVGMATRSSGKQPAKTSAADMSSDPAPTKPAPPVDKTVAKPEQPPAPLFVDHDARLKAALADLHNKRTCEDRRAQIAIILELDDASAIPALKAARYRGYGGLLGIGEKNANWCMVKDIDAAVKELSARHPVPAPPPPPSADRTE